MLTLIDNKARVSDGSRTLEEIAVSDSADASVAGIEVLLVEDHVETAEMLIAILEEEGCSVRWAQTAKDALVVLTPPRGDEGQPGRPPDVVLLDLTLPDMSGGDMIRQLRRNRAPVPPVVVASAMPGRKVLEEANLIGACGVCYKPFHIEDLLAALAAAVAPDRARGRICGPSEGQPTLCS